MLKVITRPSVFLLFATDFGPGYRDFLDHIGAESWNSDSYLPGDIAPEVAGRTCYNSFKNPRPGGNRAYLDRILSEAHGSVLEHTHFVLAICGISRIISQEITRHRHHSPSQLSQRFVDESESAFVLPAVIDLDDEEYSRRPEVDIRFIHGRTIEDGMAIRQWGEACEQSLRNYQLLVKTLEFKVEGSEEAKTTKRKRIREAARGVLVNDIETRLVLSGNARAWRWFLERRGTSDCALEMRRLAVAIFRVLQPVAPAIFQDGEVVSDEDGRESLRFFHHKV